MKKGNMMKALALVLALMTALALAGCGKTVQQSSLSGADESASVQASESASAQESESAETSATLVEGDFTIGVTQIVDHPSLNLCRQGAINKLAELGFVEGQNLTISYEDAQGDPNIATTIAQQFVSDEVDAILAIATPCAQAAYAASMGQIPLVFSAVSEPAAAGLSNEDGTNLAGVTGTSDKLPMEATFKLIQQLTPDVKTIGILHNTGEVNSDMQLAQAKEMAPNYGFTIEDVGVTSTNEISSALDTLLPKVDAVMNLTDNMVVSSLALIVQRCNEAKIPLYGSEETQAQKGALASAGLDYYALGQINGEMVAKVLTGTPAEDIEIAMLTEPKLIINTDQMALLGLTIPDSLSTAQQVTTDTTTKQ
jgi:putative ABC transport system substrate-binding protein